ncbi:hypothetical protein VP01_6114g1 [Puccinia sorghi]|uniref:Uncharacterized protein n=1 Tax=Puccinia sorghi TaxID=27349 RepID=A0A0L6UJ30_9BASI|nr:hypothetical protein VP01_6114g1 [Puccinia sorghi]
MLFRWSISSWGSYAMTTTSSFSEGAYCIKTSILPNHLHLDHVPSSKPGYATFQQELLHVPSSHGRHSSIILPFSTARTSSSSTSTKDQLIYCARQLKVKCATAETAYLGGFGPSQISSAVYGLVEGQLHFATESGSFGLKFSFLCQPTQRHSYHPLKAHRRL